MRLRHLLIALVALATAAATLGPELQPAFGRPRYKITTKKIAPGLTYTQILDRRVPNRIKVLEVNPTSRMTIDPVLAARRLPGRKRTSAMSRRGGAVAAVNGTFGLPSGRPLGVFLEDGHLKTSSLLWGRAFSMSHDEQQAFFGHPKERYEFKRATEPPRRVYSWNESSLAPGRIGGYTRVGGSSIQPPRRSCSVRLFARGALEWGDSGMGVERNYLVDRVRCSRKSMSRRGGIVLSAIRGDDKTRALSSMTRGEKVRLSWSLGWPFVLDAIPGNPTLIENGKSTAYTCGAPFCRRGPRTGVGLNKEGHLLLVTVDGRQKRSRGVTLVEFARIFRMLDSTWALNLDGGGSTTMVVRDRVVNHPSDRAEREVSSTILVLPGPDPKEPRLEVSAPSSPSLPTNPALAPEIGPSHDRVDVASPGSDPALTDPASTGGLLDALERGTIGAGVDLPKALDRIVSSFRRTDRPRR